MKAISGLLFFCWFFFFQMCTNYSSEPQIVNSPVLLGIQTEDTGHLITVAAQNLEIGFLGYRLYEGSDETAVRAIPVENGTDCGPFELQPDAPVEYILEAKPNQTAVTPGQSNRVCAFNASLTTGRSIAIRSLIFSVISVNTSDISNAIVVP